MPTRMLLVLAAALSLGAGSLWSWSALTTTPASTPTPSGVVIPRAVPTRDPQAELHFVEAATLDQLNIQFTREGRPYRCVSVSLVKDGPTHYSGTIHLSDGAEGDIQVDSTEAHRRYGLP